MKEMLNIEAALAVVDYLSRNENTIRQISRIIKINHTTVTRTIKKLEKTGAVNLTKIGPSYFVKLNKTPEVFGLLTLNRSHKSNDIDQIVNITRKTFDDIN